MSVTNDRDDLDKNWPAWLLLLGWVLLLGSVYESHLEAAMGPAQIMFVGGVLLVFAGAREHSAIRERLIRAQANEIRRLELQLPRDHPGPL